MPEYEPKHDATEESSVAPVETESVEADEAEGLDKLDQPDGSDPRPPVDWRELVRDFVKPGRAQVVFAAILLILGLGVAMQVRSQAQQTDYSTMRRADLVQLLDDLNSESRRLEAEIAQLEETKRQLQSGADSERVAREEAQRRLDVLRVRVSILRFVAASACDGEPAHERRGQDMGAHQGAHQAAGVHGPLRSE